MKFIFLADWIQYYRTKHLRDPVSTWIVLRGGHSEIVMTVRIDVVKEYHITVTMIDIAGVFLGQKILEIKNYQILTNIEEPVDESSKYTF